MMSNRRFIPPQGVFEKLSTFGGYFSLSRAIFLHYLSGRANLKCAFPLKYALTDILSFSKTREDNRVIEFA